MKPIISILLITTAIFTTITVIDRYERPFKTGNCFAENGGNIMLIEIELKDGIVATNLSEKDGSKKYYIKYTTLISGYDKIDCEAINFNNIR